MGHLSKAIINGCDGKNYRCDQKHNNYSEDCNYVFPQRQKQGIYCPTIKQLYTSTRKIKMEIYGEDKKLPYPVMACNKKMVPSMCAVPIWILCSNHVCIVSHKD